MDYFNKDKTIGIQANEFKTAKATIFLRLNALGGTMLTTATHIRGNSDVIGVPWIPAHVGRMTIAVARSVRR